MFLHTHAYIAINNSNIYFEIASFFIAIIVLYQLYSILIKSPSVSKNIEGAIRNKSVLLKNNTKSFGLKSIIESHVFSSDINSINLNKKCIINTINPHSYCISKSDSKFQKALIKSDILLPDGYGIVLASRILRRKRINKIAGADIHMHILEHANSNHKKIFYLGATDATLELITKRLKSEYPNIKVSNYSPPYKSEFSSDDSKKMIEAVNSFYPDILFVGMTAPKQEKWVAAHKQHLTPTIIASIGAVFDFYAGTVKRSSPFWIKLGLEWLPRLLKEPRRLWKRNFVSTPLFLLSLGKAKLLNFFL